MSIEGSDIVARRNEGNVSALCKHVSGLSLDPKSFSSGSDGHDIVSLFSRVLQVSRNGAPLKNEDEIMKWVAFANNFLSETEACHSSLLGLNEDLTKRTILLGDGLRSSEADIIVFSAVHSFVSHLSSSDRQKFPNVLRWMDYIQNKEDFGGAFEKIILEKTRFVPNVCLQNTDKLEADPKSKKATQGLRSMEKSEAADVDLTKCSAEKKKAFGGGKVVEEEKKISEKEDLEVSISVLNIQVGVIRKAWKHPSADSLLVEEIDLGGGNLRQVVSGLAKFCTPEDLTSRRVVLITNVKPGKLRDVMSAGLVLCASNEDHTVVEPLLPPEGAMLGECVSFAGHEGKPVDVLNPKKKQLEKITPHLYTDGTGVATYKGIPFMTSVGSCTSSISNGSIK